MTKVRRRARSVVALWLAVALVAVTLVGLGTARAGAQNSTWTPVAAHFLAQPGEVVESVSCPAAHACTAVASSGGGAAATGRGPALIYELDGVWQPVNLPPLPSDVPSGSVDTLLGVSCPSALDCTAVGEATPPSGTGAQMPEGALILNETAGSWTDDSPPLANAGEVRLTAVDCPTTQWCAAVGSELVSRSGRSPEHEGLVLAGFGQQWSAETVAPAGSLSSALQAISCPQANNCTAVGVQQRSLSVQLGVVVSLSDGTISWRTSPLPHNGQSVDALDGISCPALAECTAVGEYNTHSYQHGLIVTESAGRWTASPSPWSADIQGLYSVSCYAPRDCEAVGTVMAENLSQQPVVLSKLGGKWIPAELSAAPGATPFPGPGYGTTFSSLSCLPSRCVIVGTYVDGNGAARGVVLYHAP